MNSNALPVGILTFLMTDIEGSTRLWSASPRAAREALTRHDRIVEEHVERSQGRLVESGREGDSVLAVFRQASDAVSCALDMQRAFQRETWPEGVAVRVRIALYTGEAQPRSGHYVGTPLYRCARLMSTAHGGQVVVSTGTAELVADTLPEDAGLLDLGRHRLKDFDRSEYVFQLIAPDLRRDFPPLQSLETVRSNLPEQLTSFVGRQSDLAALRKVIKGSRLVTLVGPGGVGKSRLAIQLARSIDFAQPDGIWWVDLTPIEELAEVPPAIASSLGLYTPGDVSKNILSFLQEKHALLVLDNCEHLIDACGDFARQVLERSRGLSILATSREPLGVQGEALWMVNPMGDRDAAELFERRARLVQPGFEIGTGNSQQVADICRQVDQLPLAIELAASKLGVMSEGEISRQLARSLDLLTGGPRTETTRHQTMSATIDWSYSQLSPVEQALFRRLAVFRGGLSLDSAIAVCSDHQIPDVPFTLFSLVKKSMVSAFRLEDGSTRYRLLELQTAFAEGQIRSLPSEWGLTQRRHYDFFLAGLTATSRRIAGRTGKPGVTLSDEKWKRLELGNLRAAFRWAQANADDKGLSMAPDILLIDSSDLAVGRRVLHELLDTATADDLTRLWALDVSALLAGYQGDFKGLERLAPAFDEVVRKASDHESVADSLNYLGLMHWGTSGQREPAVSVLSEGLDIARTTSNKRLMANLQNTLALVLLETGDATSARPHLVEAVTSMKSIDDVAFLASYLDSLAASELACGDHRAAEQTWRETIVLAGQLGDFTNAIASLAGLACTASAGGDHARAARLAASNRKLAERWSVQALLCVLQELTQCEKTSRQALGDRRAEEARKDGAAMTLEQAIEYAVEPNPPTPSGPEILSRRERQVTPLVAQGMTNRAIATKLFLSERTVEGHIERIRDKLGLRSRSELAAWAVDQGIAEIDKH